MVRGNFVVLRSETRYDCVFRYFDGSPVLWIEEQWPKYASYWTKSCLQFSDGTSVIGTSSDANEKAVRNFAIIRPDGIKRSTFEHEDVCSIAIFADEIVITSTTIGVKKIWSRDGKFIIETRKGPIYPTLLPYAGSNLWEMSLFNNQIKAIHVWVLRQTQLKYGMN